MNTPNLNILLSRTNLSIPFDELISQIEVGYPQVGKVSTYDPINEGYEDANIILNTTTGKYVLKIFLNERTDRTIQDYVKVIQSAKNAGVPTLELIEGNDGVIGKVSQPSLVCKYIITKYFDGVNFSNFSPSKDEMILIAGYLAKLNTLTFPIEETYDSWGNKNLCKEYALNKDRLKPEQLSLIVPIVDEFNRIDFSLFSKAVIHGDMQRKHVLKNSKNQYLILDFGCMSYDLKVFDLSTYLAWFCLNDSEARNSLDLILHEVIDEYCSLHELSKTEIDSIKPLIKAAYAAYYQKTSILINDGDTSKETLDWHNQAKQMLMRASEW